MRGKRAKRLRAAARQGQKSVRPNRAKRILLFAAPVVVLLAGVAAVGHFGFFRSHSAKPVAASTPPPVKVVRMAKTLDDLLRMPAENIQYVDIAEMNLHCAEGLPGAERLDIAKCLARLDEWAERVRDVTGRHLYRAHDPRWAEHYKHSENWLRVEFLAQILQEDCGVHYNMQRIRDIDFGNSKDLFIHGMIDDSNGGTCTSMPVMHVAVGRRLGYPLRLVLTRAHIFVRWDDGQERFNVESTGEGGTDSYPDEHYKTWPEKWNAVETRANRYLISLTPAEELACFLGSRGHCLLDNGHAKEALDTYATARRLAPLDPAYPSWMRMAQSRLPGYRDPLAEAERIIANQQEAARREWMRGQAGGTTAPRLPNGIPVEGPSPPRLGVPQPPLPYGPYGPQPGVPQPYQPPVQSAPSRP